MGLALYVAPEVFPRLPSYFYLQGNQIALGPANMTNVWDADSACFCRPSTTATTRGRVKYIGICRPNQVSTYVSMIVHRTSLRLG